MAEPTTSGLAAIPAVVECINVSRIYGTGNAQTIALRDVNLRILRGEILAVVGPSGCGKSTLLHLLGAMDRPDRGKILISGHDLASMSDIEASRFRRSEVGFIFQFFNLIPTLTVIDNVALPARLSGLSARETRRTARDLLSRVGISVKGDEHPDTLSGGQQQRVAIARALINTPRLLLADEPTGALDRKTGEEVLTILREVVVERGATLVMATHSEEIVALADRTLHLEDGRVTSLTERNGDVP